MDLDEHMLHHTKMEWKHVCQVSSLQYFFSETDPFKSQADVYLRFQHSFSSWIKINKESTLE